MKILGFCGSLRTDSLNRKLLMHTLDILSGKGGQTSFQDLRDLQIPLYDGDLEHKSGLPTGVSQLVKLVNEAQGLVIGSPEYNGGITGVLKNTIDWLSRAEKSPFVGKPVLLVGTSPGVFGTVKSHMITRLILTHLRAYVMTTQITIPLADKALDEKGHLHEPLQVKQLFAACDELVSFVKSRNG